MPMAEGKQGSGNKQYPYISWARESSDEELAQLRKEVTDLRETNEILKKAMAFFVVKNPR